MDATNIDDLLMGGKNATQPASPESQYEIHADEPLESDDHGYESEDGEPESEGYEPESEESHEEPDQESSEPQEEDEYGNKKERMPKGMKDRLDRKDRQHRQEMEQREREIAELRAQLANKGASTEIQQAAKDFEYNPDVEGDWQQQLASFVKHTVNSMQGEQERRQKEMEEQKVQKEFQVKFQQGMERFGDFREVVGAQPIDDAMAMSLRAMDDPTAFIYAASKRNPQELERISKLRDPYARMVEMGRLEERMRRNKPTTRAPKPLGRTQEDSLTPQPKKKTGDSIEDLIAKSDANRLARMKQSGRR